MFKAKIKYLTLIVLILPLYSVVKFSTGISPELKKGRFIKGNF